MKTELVSWKGVFANVCINSSKVIKASAQFYIYNNESSYQEIGALKRPGVLRVTVDDLTAVVSCTCPRCY